MNDSKLAINLPFAVCSTVWHVGAPYRVKTVTCPECAGQRTITVTTGAGQTYTLKCHHCGPGYRDACGTVEVRVPDHTPRMVILDSLHEFRDGKATYSSLGNGLLCADSLFATREECEARCVVLRAEQQTELDRYHLAQLTHNRDRLAFSVSYWSRKLKGIEEEADRVRSYLGIARASRPQPNRAKKARDKT